MVDTFTRHHREVAAEADRNETAESFRQAAGITDRSSKFRPVDAEYFMTALGDTDEERRRAVDDWAAVRGVESGWTPAGYSARLELSGLAITVMATPVRADRPAPVVTEDEGSDERELAKVA